MSDYWFRSKKFGYGYEPISWQGWLLTLSLVGLIMLNAYLNNFFVKNHEPTSSEVIRFFIGLAVITIGFMTVFSRKCKGKAKWHWSWKKEDQGSESDEEYNQKNLQ